MTTQTSIPRDWDMVTLGEVLEQRRELIQPDDNEDTRFVGLEHIGSGESTLQSWTPATNVKSTKFRFYEGDLLYGKLRPYLDKAVEALFEGICSTDILPLVPKIEREATKYLLSVIHSRPFIQYAMSHTSGTNHPRTSWNAISRYMFLLPPKNERQRIGTILSTVDTAIQKSKVATKETERLKQGMMQELLTNGIEHLEFKNDTFGRIPKVWTTNRLGSCSERPEYGLTTSANEKPVGPKFLRITDITDTGVDWSEVPFCICSSEEEEKYALKKGDLVFARIGATTGKSYLVNETRRAVFASYLIRVRCKDIILPEYLGYFTQSHQYWEYINKTKTGQLKGGINIPIICSIPILIPPISEQKQIVAILSTIDRKLDLQRQRTAALEQLKQGLMNDLLTGKRRVMA